MRAHRTAAAIPIVGRHFVGVGSLHTHSQRSSAVMARRWCARNATPVTTLPSSRVETTTPAYTATRTELSLLSVETFTQRMHRFSRVHFENSELAAAHAHLMELIHSDKIIQMHTKAVYEHLHLAYVAGLYDLCLAAYHARRDVATDAHSASPAVVPSEYVVDSAYEMGSSTELVRLAAHSAKIIQSSTQDGTANAEENTLLATFSLLRSLWRAVCVEERLKREGGASNLLAARQAHADAENIFTESILPTLVGLPTTEASAAAESPSVEAPPSTGKTSQRIRCASWLRLVRRCVVYDTSGDAGEWLYFRLCRLHGLLATPATHTIAMSAAVAAEQQTRGSSSITSAEVSPIELFYATLINTCAVGRHTKEAIGYYEELRRTLCPSSDFCLMADSLPTHPASPAGTSVASMSEYVLYRLLSVLHGARDNRRVVQIVRESLQGSAAMTRSGLGFSLSVWSLVLISAGEMRAADIVLHAYGIAERFLLGENQSSSTSFVYDRRGVEYLLQMSLSSLSKCQMKNYEADYLRPAVDNGLLHCSQELYFCCLLQDAHNAMDAYERVVAVRHRMDEMEVPLTPPIISRLLKVYLRVEAAEYLDTYRHAVYTLKHFRRAWLDGMFLWADRRRYELTHQDRTFILEEARRVVGGDGRHASVKDAMGSLRTQYALLEYDHNCHPLDYFREHGVPPPDAPTTMDSRMYFLVRRPYCAVRGVALRSHDAPPTCTELLVGDPLRKHDVALYAELAGPIRSLNQQEDGPEGSATSGERYQHSPEMEELLFRTHLADLLEGLQRTNNSIGA